MALSPAHYSVLQVELPGAELTSVGVLLEDVGGAELHLRLRRDWSRLAGEDDAEVLELLADDLARKAGPGDLGAAPLLEYLEDSQSNLLRITAREAIEVEDFERALNRLYREHVQSNVVPFRTHLPLYSLRAAAGKFLENDEIAQQDWLEAPEDLRLAPEMFVARIAGQSMEPDIPDGSLCVFRHNVIGSRDGRLVLVEDRQGSGNNRYSVKRYRSEKQQNEAGWAHRRIRLESLNPDFPSWNLEPEEDRYAVIAEFVRVLE